MEAIGADDGEATPKLNYVAAQRVAVYGDRTGSQSARTGHWSPDGTCIIATTPDNSIETIVVPQDLLEPRSFHDLTPFSKFSSSDPIYSTAVYPQFQLADPSTTCVLYAAREHPIQLRNALDYDQGIWASYPFNDPNTEAVIAPHSMIFTKDASHFVAGAQARFAVYDVTRPRDKAVRIIRTSKSARARSMYGDDPHSNTTTQKSIITAMDISCEDILAFGTTTRHLALYESHGTGDLIMGFRLAGDGAKNGTGITQIKWSPCGTYLFVAERQSDTVQLYDIRRSGMQLGSLIGRQADVKFKLSFDITTTAHGLEVWAGGVDGNMRMWSNPEQQQGDLTSAAMWKVHDDPVSSTLVHPGGYVVATLSTKDRHAGEVSVEQDEDGGEINLVTDEDEAKEVVETSSDSSDSSDESDAFSDSDSHGDHEMDSVSISGNQISAPHDSQGQLASGPSKISAEPALNAQMKIWSIQ